MFPDCHALFMAVDVIIPALGAMPGRRRRRKSEKHRRKQKAGETKGPKTIRGFRM